MLGYSRGNKKEATRTGRVGCQRQSPCTDGDRTGQADAAAVFFFCDEGKLAVTLLGSSLLSVCLSVCLSVSAAVDYGPGKGGGPPVPGRRVPRLRPLVRNRGGGRVEPTPAQSHLRRVAAAGRDCSTRLFDGPLLARPSSQPRRRGGRGRGLAHDSGVVLRLWKLGPALLAKPERHLATKTLISPALRRRGVLILLKGGDEAALPPPSQRRRAAFAPSLPRSLGIPWHSSPTRLRCTSDSSRLSTESSTLLIVFSSSVKATLVALSFSVEATLGVLRRF